MAYSNFSKCACNDYFNNLKAVDYSLNFLTYFIEASYNFSAAKPFLPIAILDPNNNNQIDFTNSKNFSSFFKDIMEDCLTASYNFLNDSVADPQYLSGSGKYGIYLSQRVSIKSTESKYNTYKTIYNTILDFWANFVASGDYVTDLNRFQSLVDYMKDNTNKRFWVAPGSYHVSGANPSNVTADLINAANPTWGGNIPVLILELNSIA